MLTTPITTPYFHSRVLTLVANYMHQVDVQEDQNLPIPTIPPLSPVDTPLAPDEIVSQLLAVASPWIDLASPDPVIYNISKQVLELEVAYAAFCGVGNVILPIPKLHHGKLHGEGISQYGHAIQEALEIGSYIQLSVSMRMMDVPEEEDTNDQGSLAARARGRYMGTSANEWERPSTGDSEDDLSDSRSLEKATKFDYFGTWDAWNLIRTICKYNSRLFVGKTYATHSSHFFHILFVKRFLI